MSNQKELKNDEKSDQEQIVLSATLFAVFTIIIQFPITLLVSKIGKRNGSILGNTINVFWALAIMSITSFKGLIIVQLISSIAFSFKSISESNLLSDSIPKTKNESEIFTNIDR